MKPTVDQVERGFWWNQIDANAEDFERVFPSNRAGIFTQPNILTWDWHFGRDFAAYAYELARRKNRQLGLRKYPELSADESQFLLRIFGCRKSRKMNSICIRNVNPEEPLKREEGYSQPIICRLDAPMHTLKQSFARFVEQQQKQYNIKPKSKPGMTSKSPPWSYIEILDKADLLKLRQTKGADPGRTLRTARSQALKYYKLFIGELAENRSLQTDPKQHLWPELERLPRR